MSLLPDTKTTGLRSVGQSNILAMEWLRKTQQDSLAFHNIDAKKSFFILNNIRQILYTKSDEFRVCNFTRCIIYFQKAA